MGQIGQYFAFTQKVTLSHPVGTADSIRWQIFFRQKFIFRGLCLHCEVFSARSLFFLKKQKI